MGRGENSLLYGDYLYDILDKLNISEKHDFSPPLPFGADRILKEIESLGYHNNPGEDYLIEDILTPKDCLFKNENVFRGEKNPYNPARRNTLNNNQLYSEFSGNSKIYIRSRTLHDEILHDSVVNSYAQPRTIFENHRELYDLLRSLNNIKTKDDDFPEKDLYALTDSELKFHSVVNAEAYATLEHCAQNRKRGLAVSIVSSDSDTNDNQSRMWIFESEMRLVESLSWRAASPYTISSKSEDGEWKFLKVINGHKDYSNNSYLGFFIDNKAYGIIKTESNTSALVYS